MQAAFDRKSVLLKKQEAKIKDFTHQTGLYRDRAREQSYGFNKSVSQKAVHKAEKHYQTWVHDIGATGTAPKTLAEYYKNKYNDTWEHQMLMGYNNAVKKGDISPLVGFERYTKIAEDANAKLIGKITFNGHTINAYTTHFIDRVIGQVSTPHDGKRLGVSIDDVLECLINSNTEISKPYIRIIKRNNESFQDERIRYKGKKCVVTISLTDGRIIQVNPRS